MLLKIVGFFVIPVQLKNGKKRLSRSEPAIKIERNSKSQLHMFLKGAKQVWASFDLFKMSNSDKLAFGR